MPDIDPDRRPLTAAAVTSAVVRDGGFWTTVEVVDSVPSSNALVAERALAGVAHAGSVVIAEEQTAGRGRQGRSWDAPKYSSLMVSSLLRPPGDPSHWGWMPLVTALALTDAVGHAGLVATIKWPNDVLIDGHKVAGILCEVVQTSAGPALVAGWGLNVDQGRGELATERATSVQLAGGAGHRIELLGAAMAAWETWLMRWDGGSARGVAEVSCAYRERSSTLGRRVRADLPDGTALLGMARRLDDQGRLVVVAGEKEHTVAAADVVHLHDHL